MSQKSLQVGILAFEAIQFLDASPVDLFGMLTREYLEACQLPSPLVELGQQVDFHYISAGGSGTVVSMTSNAGLQITAGLEDEAVKPGKLDILLIPGPDPRAATPDAYKRFLKGHADHGTTILSICTGIIPAGRSGILNGKRVTGPRALLPTLRKQFPEAKWEDKRWMKDGNLWCSAGITNGQDMVGAYIRERFPGPLSETVLAMADVGERSQEYNGGVARMNTFFVWQVVRAWFGSFTKK